MKTPQSCFRLSALAVAVLDALSEKHGLTRTAYLEFWLRKEGRKLEASRGK